MPFFHFFAGSFLFAANSGNAGLAGQLHIRHRPNYQNCQQFYQWLICGKMHAAHLTYYRSL